MDLKQKNKLLFARAGFGISVENYLQPQSVDAAVAQLFPQFPPHPLNVVTEDEWLHYNPAAIKEMRQQGETAELKEMKKAFRERTKDLNLLWVQTMVASPSPLLEKAALFWHGHFACRIENPYFEQKLLHILRSNALGNFGTMLREVSKSPAMLQFLNNQQNKKQHPNENFAREVMELFTLGRGHYTEEDIKEAARAFTGWAYDGDGAFIFRPRQHDDGEKKFLGKTGNFNGDDILDILLAQKQTAITITQKIYTYFVSDELMDEKRVKELAKDFYDSNYDIGRLLKTIFSADWFYKDNIPGSKIKAPVELLVGYQHTLPLTFDNPKTMLNLQRILGQYLFYPPNVAGWPGGKNWIDSSSLAIRMRLPEALLGSKELNLSPKETDAEMPDNKRMQPIAGTVAAAPPKPFRVGKAATNWDAYIAAWKGVKRADLANALAAYLVNVPLSATQVHEVDSFADKDSDEDYIKSITILLMELPEYQLT